MRKRLPPFPLKTQLLCASFSGLALLAPAAQAQDAIPAPTDDIPTLGDVNVTATLQNTTLWETPASVQVVNSAAFDNSPKVNLSEGLARVPGLQVQNRNNYAQDLQLVMRGFGARAAFGVRGIRIYVDDIPATLADGQAQTSNIDLSSLDRIEVLNGPFSAMYGNAAGGVIQVTSKSGHAPNSIGADVVTGSDGMVRYGVNAQGATGAKTGLTDYTLSANRFRTDGFRAHSDAKRGIVNARLGIQLNDSNKLKLVANYVDITAQNPLGLTREEMDQDRRMATPNAEKFNTRKNVYQGQLGAVLESRLNADNQLRVMAYHGSRHTKQYMPIPAAPQRNNPGHAGGMGDLERRYSGLDVRWTSAQKLGSRDLLLVTGLAYDYLREARKGYENFTGPKGKETLGVQGALRRDETNTVWNVDPYIQGNLQLTDSVSVDAGMRYTKIHYRSDDHYLKNGDDSGNTSYSAFLPSAALRWDLNDRVNVYTSVGRGFEAPTTIELSYKPGVNNPGLNLGLQPAKSTNWETGTKIRLTDQSLFTAAVFRTDTKNEIVVDSSTDGRTSYQNANKTRRTGLELSYSQQFLEHAQLDIAYAWINAKYRTGSDKIPCGNLIPGIPKQTAYVGLAWAPQYGWQAGADLSLATKMQVDDSNSATAASYTVAGLYGGYVWRIGQWKLRGFARVDNVFDRKYVGSIVVNDSNKRFYEPAQGRNWSAGLSANWEF